MSIADVHGWVEVKATVTAWLSMIVATTLIYGSETTCPIEFPGWVRGWESGKLIKQVHEGLPPDVTDPTRRDAERYAPYAGSHCWVTWAEIAQTEWQHLRGDWEVLFLLMEVLSLRYQPEDIRLILWVAS